MTTDIKCPICNGGLDIISTTSDGAKRGIHRWTIKYKCQNRDCAKPYTRLNVESPK